MKTIEAIITRRSIRKYLNKPVEKEKADTLLNSAMYAPSARNYQPWEFIVVDERKILDELSSLHPYAKMLQSATLAILVCGNRNIEESENYLIQNCSAATQNILLAAHALGLGSVWLGIQPRKDRIENMIKKFHLPDHIVPISLIAVGYPDESKPVPERYNHKRVKYNKWN